MKLKLTHTQKAKYSGRTQEQFGIFLYVKEPLT